MWPDHWTHWLGPKSGSKCVPFGLFCLWPLPPPTVDRWTVYNWIHWPWTWTGAATSLSASLCNYQRSIRRQWWRWRLLRRWIHVQRLYQWKRKAVENEKSSNNIYRGTTSGPSGQFPGERVLFMSFIIHLLLVSTLVQIDSNPDGQDLERIATLTGLSKRVTQVWFQNSRARQKKYMNKSRAGHQQPNIGGSNQSMNGTTRSGSTSSADGLISSGWRLDAEMASNNSNSSWIMSNNNNSGHNLNNCSEEDWKMVPLTIGLKRRSLKCAKRWAWKRKRGSKEWTKSLNSCNFERKIFPTLNNNNCHHHHSNN